MFHSSTANVPVIAADLIAQAGNNVVARAIYSVMMQIW